MLIDYATRSGFCRAADAEYVAYFIPAATLVRIQNIADYFWATCKPGELHSPKDHPFCNLPWNPTLAEWSQPNPSGRQELGVLAYMHEDPGEERLPEAHWRIVVFPYIREGFFPKMDVYLNAEGTILGTTTNNDDWSHFGIDPDHVRSSLLPFWSAMSFANLKDTEKVEHRADQATRYHMNKAGMSVCSDKYYTLRIPKLERLLIEIRSQHGIEGEKAMRIHMVRGHFKLFLPDRPLFKRFTGRYWWHPHMRGTAKRGRINKDYEILPPAGG